MRKILAPLMFAAALMVSPVAMAEVSEDTWAQLEGQPVLLTNPQGKEIRGTLLDADGDTIRIERADGSVVTVGKSEVATAKSLAAGSTDRRPGGSSTDEDPGADEVTVGSSERRPAEQAPAEPTPAPAESPSPAVKEDIPSQAQDAVNGEVDGRSAAQQESMVLPTAAGLGCGVGAGFVGTSCCWFPCLGAAGTTVLYAALPPEHQMVDGSDTYIHAYNQAYASELKKRRMIWSGVGAAAGVAIGGTTALVVWNAVGTSTLPNPTN